MNKDYIIPTQAQLNAEELEIRKLRAAVYGECTDDEWMKCRGYWLVYDKMEWLKAEVLKSV